jgi:drug/metabolite transporter (DMT)-like permease
MKRSTLLLLFLFNAIWGGTYPATKFLMAEVPYYLATSTRFLLAALPIALIAAARHGWRMDRVNLARCAAIGLATFTVSPLLLYAGVRIGRAADAAIITAAEPLLIAVGAWLYLRERLTRRTIAALGIAFVGAALLSEFWRDARQIQPVSIALMGAAVCCEAVYSVLGKKVLERYAPLQMLAAALLTAAAVNGAAVGALGWWLRLGQFSAASWAVLLGYLVLVCTVIGYLFWNSALRETQTANVAITIFVQPVAGILISWAWLGERPSIGQALGAATIVSAVIAATWKRPIAPPHPE